MSHCLYKRPAYPRPWEHDRDQKNERPVMFARNEEHAEQLRQRMKRRKVFIDINPVFFEANKTNEG